MQEMNDRRYYIAGSAVFLKRVVKEREPVLGDQVIWDDGDLEMHLHYIHYNPVKHGYVTDPRDWKESSYIEWEKRGLYPPVFGWNEPRDVNWGE